MRQVVSADYSASVDISTLFERLTNLPDGPDGFSKEIHSRWPRTESLSSTRTSPSGSEDIESICCGELIQNGGRPVVPIEVLSQALREPKRRYEKELPWLDDPRSRDRDDGMPRVFQRQADRWWGFRKWQLDNRDPAFRDDGFSAYLAAQKRRHSLSGSHDMVSSPTFEETVRRQWGMRPMRLEVPSNAGFPAYEEAVKKRLVSHHFTREFRLEGDPRQQGVWATWVEYLNFEYWEADRLIDLLRTLQPRYRNAWNDLQRHDTPQPFSLGNVAESSSKTSSATASCLEQQLATTKAELEALRQKMDSFIRETKQYRRAEEDAHHQKILTQWVLEQLFLIEAEATLERAAVERDQDKAPPRKKRRRHIEDEEAEVKEAPAEDRSKRLKRGGVLGGGTAQHSAQGRPQSSSKATISTDLATATSTRVTRQLRRPRQVAGQQANAGRTSQRSQRSTQTPHPSDEHTKPLGQRRSKRLEAHHLMHYDGTEVRDVDSYNTVEARQIPHSLQPLDRPSFF